MARTARSTELHLVLPDAPAPLRHRISEALIAAVREGRLRPGDPLPATRALSRQLGVARGAVVAAYDELVAAGFVDPVAGSGTYVAQGADRAARAGAAAHVQPPAGPPPMPRRPRRQAPPGEHVVALDLRPGLPDASLLDQAAWRRAWRQSSQGPVPLGLDPAEHAAATTALAGHLRRTRGVLAEPDEILLVPGVTAGLRALVRGSGLAGAQVALEDPGYRDALMAVEEVARPRLVPVDDGGLDPARLTPEDRGVYVTPAHQFPLGGRMSVERRADLLSWARRTGGLVIEDDYDGEFRYDVSPLPALQSMSGGRDHVVYVGTASKVLTTSVRLAWVVAPPHLQAALAAAIRDLGLTVNPMVSRAVGHLIASGSLATHLARASRTYAARRAALVQALQEALPRLSPRGIDAGLHLVLPLPAGVDDAPLCEALAADGVATEPLSMYAQEARQHGLVLGYARLPETRAAEAAAAIARHLDHST